MSPDFVNFMVSLGGSSFWGGNSPVDLKVLGFMGGDPSPTVELVGSGGGGLISSRSIGFSG